MRDHFRRPEEAMRADDFEALAQAVFRHQVASNPAYGAYCRALGRLPEAVDVWRRIPPVPASAFKRLDLFSGLPASSAKVEGTEAGAMAGTEPEIVFETSGTRRGRELRGRHPVASLELYREASMPWFGRHLVPEDQPLTVLALLPSPEVAPHSSLSRMAGFAVERWGRPRSRFLADPDAGVDGPSVREALDEAREEAAPVLLLGTAFAWVHWLEWAEAQQYRARLPEGSRLMETGGFKGRSREIPRDELYRRLQETLGLPRHRMVNEYGMTELLSQMYEPVLVAPEAGDEGQRDDRAPTPAQGAALSGSRAHRAPPWLGIRVLDPETLEPLPPGQVGLLSFMDLANVASVSAVLTEDLGRLDSEGGLHLQGRAPGAEPRGCSLALEEMLEAQS